MQDSTVPASPLTAEDVRVAVEQLGGPNHTNAAKIREVLGRGSLATIQKHLQALREAEKGPEPEAQVSVPMVPEAVTEALRGLWAVAWAMAEQRHAESLANALDAVQRLSDDLAAAQADIESLTAEADQARERVTGAEARAEAAEQALRDGQTAMAAEREALESVMAQLRALLPTA
jgi:chromosome segregation ATPase